MRILSVCTNLPTRNHPQRGLFVHRRLEMLSKLAPLRALNPQVWFPWIRPKKVDTPLESIYPIDAAPMFYIPGVAKSLDGKWMARTVGAWLDALPKSETRDAVLDAHFGYPEGVGCALAAKRRGIPFFVTIRGLEVDILQRHNEGKQLVNALNSAERVIAVSEFLKQSAISAGVDGNRVVVISNGVDSSFYSPGNYARSRDELNIAAEIRLLVSVGNLKPVKGHDVLIRALAATPRELNVKLVCIGSLADGHWYKRIKQLVAELNLQERVIFTGSKPPEDIVRWLRASDQFVLASRREGCCNAVLEALSVGVPVVATKVGDNSQYVQDGVSGRLVNSENHHQFAEAIATTLQQSYCRDQISQSMRGHSWEHAAQQVMKVMSDHA